MMELESRQSDVRGKKPPPTTTQWESPFECGYPSMGAVGAPLFELNSVKISGQLLHQICAGAGGVQIHGRIILIDYLDNRFSLFSRNQSDLLFINLHNSSLILGRDKFGGPRCLPSVFWLKFQLKIKGDTEEHVVEFSMFIDCTNDVIYDKLQQDSHTTPGLEVLVEYIIFRYAVLARPGFVVEKSQNTDDDSDIVDVDLSGSIEVCYQTNDLSWIIQRPFGEKQKLKLGDFTEGPTLAVPAYATVSSALDLHVNGEYFEGTRDNLKFDTNAIEGISFEKQIHGKKYLFRLILYWGIAIRELPENKLREWCDDDDKSRISNAKSRWERNIPFNDQPDNIQPLLQSLNNRSWIVSDSPEELVEIFSISICFSDAPSKSLGLKGSIFCYDINRQVDLFKGNALHRNGDIVKLAAVDHCFTGWCFSIYIKLEDNDGREICHGYAAYNENNVEGWFNRRICSVIRGTYGYAALHYSIFQDAIVANLSFNVRPWSSPTSVISNPVWGYINTMYSNLRYSTDYEKKYYQSRLFEKQELEAVRLDRGEIPLSKSVVAVPLNASLLVEGDIHVKIDGKPFNLQFEKTFVPSVIEEPSKDITGLGLDLFVHVDWVRK